jgi:hypothetical protein
MPKFGAGQYGAEISTLLQTNSDVIHSSLWGGDLEAFMLQANPRGLFKKGQLVLVAGEPYLHRLGSNIPDGTLIGKVLIPEIVANVAFGGVKRNRLFIAGTTSLYAIYLTVRGARPG